MTSPAHAEHHHQLPPPLDFSPYPPFPVAWAYTAVDTVCGTLSPVPWLDCSDWRNWLPSSFTANGAWLAPENKCPTAVIDLLPPLTTYQEFSDNFQQQQEQLEPPSTWATLSAFAATPSTTLADLTSGSALIAMIGLVWMMRRMKVVVIPFFSKLGRQAALRTHGAEWCAQPANDIRIQKFGEYVFRLCFHSAISLAGVIIFWDSPWWAEVLGRSGPTLASSSLLSKDGPILGTQSLFLDFPFQPIQPSMIWYYLVQAAYNVEAMICLLELSLSVQFQSIFVPNATRLQCPIHVGWSKKVRGDFREMFIHHIVTNLLIFGSSFIRMTRVGSMVFLVHDISDVPVDLSKLANFLKWKATTASCFALMVLVWSMTRLYILPFVIFRSVIWESWLVCANGYIHPIYYVLYRPPFVVLVFVLILLHLIWFSMFIQMGYVLIRKGEAHDLSEHKKGEQHPQQQVSGGGDGACTANGTTTAANKNTNGTRTSNGVRHEDKKYS